MISKNVSAWMRPGEVCFTLLCYKAFEVFVSLHGLEEGVDGIYCSVIVFTRVGINFIYLENCQITYFLDCSCTLFGSCQHDKEILLCSLW